MSYFVMCRCGEMFIFAEMALPDEACSVSLFKHNIKSFTINIYGEPKRHPLCNLPDPPNSQSTSVQKQPLTTTNRLVMCQSLCLWHLKEKIKINYLKPVLTRFQVNVLSHNNSIDSVLQVILFGTNNWHQSICYQIKI